MLFSQSVSKQKALEEFNPLDFEKEVIFTLNNLSVVFISQQLSLFSVGMKFNIYKIKIAR